eukprot:CAMPEP_0195055906 /NCGR_PEP_ID=MMETSP0448-20130528/4483_1 /TAXON_ID=66468 /ORGANISM="Heterocapsa triquestra, Strain CCMP 448" /LENGTH=388 /DNA_ID=CAMNT_0040085655 /DNA_START=41 /DNA_END=1207 /DNA_ORIENTATION=-
MAPRGPLAASSEEGNKLFVGGLSAQTTTEALRAHFLRYGLLIDAVVMQRNGRPRGFGFVTYDTPTAATAAVSEPQWLDGRYVDVKWAVPGEPLTPPSGVRSPAERGGGSANKLFVGGLPQDATSEDLKMTFGTYGNVADAVVMVDRRTSRSRGFGFVRFGGGQAAGAAAADAALNDFPSHRLGGKWVEVKRATPAAVLQELSTCGQAGMTDLCSPSMMAMLEQQAGMYFDGFEYERYLSCWEGQRVQNMGNFGVYNDLMSPSAAWGHVCGRRGRRRRQWSGSMDAGDDDDCNSEELLAFAAGACDAFRGDSEIDPENNPAIANAAQKIALPPGLLSSGVDSSPMKVAWRDENFENFLRKDRFDGFTREDLRSREDFLSTEVRPWLSAW